MKAASFYQTINKLLAINGLEATKEIELSNADKPYVLQAIELLFETGFKGEQGFITKTEVNENGLFIHINSNNTVSVYKVKPEAIAAGLPECYDNFNTKFSLSNVLLVELAIWLFNNKAQYKFAYKRFVNGLFQSVRKKMPFVASGKWYSLYITGNYYMVINSHSAGSFLAAGNNKVLTEAKALLSPVKPKKEKVVLQSDFIQNIKLSNRLVKGEVTFLNEPVKIELDTELEFPQQQDYDKLVKQLEELVTFFTEDKVHEYKMQMAKEITDSAYEQDDYTPTDDDYRELYNDFVLKKIYGAFDAFVLTFKAKKTYKGSDICLQIAYPGFEVEEVVID